MKRQHLEASLFILKYLYMVVYTIVLAIKMEKKRITTMRIDTEVLKRAHELGLNISKVSENSIKEAIKRMETPRGKKNED